MNVSLKCEIICILVTFFWENIFSFFHFLHLFSQFKWLFSYHFLLIFIVSQSVQLHFHNISITLNYLTCHYSFVLFYFSVLDAYPIHIHGSKKNYLGWFVSRSSRWYGTYVHTYVHTFVPTYIHKYIRTYIRTYVHTYIHTYIHTYLHRVRVRQHSSM